MSSLCGRRYDERSWIADSWHAGVADERYRSASGKLLQHLIINQDAIR